MNIKMDIKYSPKGYHLTGVVEGELHCDIVEDSLEKCLHSFTEEVLLISEGVHCER